MSEKQSVTGREAVAALDARPDRVRDAHQFRIALGRTGPKRSSQTAAAELSRIEPGHGSQTGSQAPQFGASNARRVTVLANSL